MHTSITNFINELRMSQGTKKRASEADMPLGCAMLECKIDNWEEITAMIEPGDLYIETDGHSRFGIENEPHVTLYFGLHDGMFPMGQLAAYFESTRVFDIDLVSVSVFKNKDYDVVKFDVAAPQLQEIHDYIEQNFPCTPSEFTFHPHMTIAYVKPGLGEKYAKPIKPITLEVSKFVYSNPEYKRKKFSPYKPKKAR